MISTRSLLEHGEAPPARRDGRRPGGEVNINVGDVERWASVLAGGGLALLGILQRSWGGAGLALLGGTLAYRGLRGRCLLYGALGISTSKRSVEAAERDLARSGVKVEKALTINVPPDDLYKFWRNFENLPLFLHHVESVRIIDGRRSHWTVKGPFGARFEWDADIINESENEMIAWKSVEGAQVDHAGSVHFRRGPPGRGTELKVSLKYNPPSGALGTAIAKLFGQDPEDEIQEDLRRLKRILEAGEIPTTEGQPSGRAI